MNNKIIGRISSIIKDRGGNIYVYSKIVNIGPNDKDEKFSNFRLMNDSSKNLANNRFRIR